MDAHRKGKILKVRLGYNANSSSLAVVAKALIWGSAAVVMVVSMISAIIFSKGTNSGSAEEENEY